MKENLRRVRERLTGIERERERERERREIEVEKKDRQKV